MKRRRMRRGRSSASDRARWDNLHATYAAKRAALDELDRELSLKYGGPGGRYQTSWLSAGAKTKLERLRASADKVGDKIYDLVTKISPRDWSHGAPAYWIREKLSWEDATRPVNEPLSVVVPAPWGAREGLK